MVKIRVLKLSPEEEGKFFALSQGNEGFQKSVQELWAEKVSFPDWCFVLESSGRLMGRVGYMANPESPQEFRMFGLILPPGEENLSRGVFLLKESFSEMRIAGGRSFFYQLHSSSGTFPAGYCQALEGAGMKILQSKKRMILEGRNYKRRSQSRLEYKTVAEVGVPFFLEAIERVTRGTLDREDRASVFKIGERKAAEHYFNILQNLDSDLQNWYAGFKETSLVGLVVPQIMGEGQGVINYLGVTVEHRGSGYSRDLLGRGIKNLLRRGAKQITADIDEENTPMGRALVEAGFVEKERIIVFSCS